jgi:hypothetical protein
VTRQRRPLADGLYRLEVLLLSSVAAINLERRMIRRTPELEAFERRYLSERSNLSYHDALALFEAMWAEARALRPDFPGDWREDIAPVLAVARAVNGLAPET